MFDATQPVTSAGVRVPVSLPLRGQPARTARESKPAKATNASVPRKRAAPETTVNAVVGETDVTLIEFDVSQVIADRDVLRNLRANDVAIEIARLAKGDLALKDIKSRKGGPDHIHRVNPNDLYCEDGQNPRNFDSAVIRQKVVTTAQSIAGGRGVREPLSVYVKGNKLYIAHGWIRWYAVLHAINFLGARIEGIPVKINTDSNNIDRLIDQFLSGEVQRWEPLEEAMLFRSVVDLGGDLKVFAKRIGHTTTAYIEDRIKLLQMPGWLQGHVSDGKTTAGTAYGIWEKAGEDDKGARELYAAGTQVADERNEPVVRPRHVKAAIEGNSDVARILKPTARTRLAAVLQGHEQQNVVQFFGEEGARELYEIAKLTFVERD